MSSGIDRACWGRDECRAFCQHRAILEPVLRGAVRVDAESTLPADATVRIVDNPQLPACAVANWLSAAWSDATEEQRLAANAGNDEDATCP